MIEQSPVDPEFYDARYYEDGSKSNYAPYGPGNWADWLVDMVVEKAHPVSVLDVGCAFGFLVERFFLKKGIPAWGFDISRYAIEEKGYFARTWVGDCTDRSAWMPVDLALAAELAEHLTPSQGRQLLENGFEFSMRMLLLIAVDLGEYEEAEEHDGSHINVVPMDWWVEQARQVGWVVSDPTSFNDDWRASQMSWSGRFLWLTKEA